MRPSTEPFSSLIMRDNLRLFTFNAFDIFDLASTHKLALTHSTRKVRRRLSLHEGASLVTDIVHVLGREWNSRDVKDCRRSFPFVHGLNRVDHILLL